MTMVKTISRKNVKYIVQVSQTGLKRKKKKPNAPESAEGKKKKKRQEKHGQVQLAIENTPPAWNEKEKRKKK
jgi:hypothetical protein